MARGVHGIEHRARCIARGTRLALSGAWCMAVAIAVLLASCTDDRSMDEPSMNETTVYPDLYLSLTIVSNNSSSTRSTTEDDGGSSDGTQQGYNLENKLEKASIYLFNNDGGELLCNFTVNRTTIEDLAVDNRNNLIVKIEPTELVKLAGKKVNMYVVGNSDDITVATENELLEKKIATVEDVHLSKFFQNGSLGKRAGIYCPLSNYTKYQMDLTGVKLPDGETDDEDNKKLINLMLRLFSGTYGTGEDKGLLWDASYGSIPNFYIGPGLIKLERTIARIDLKDEGINHSFKLDHAVSLIGLETGRVYADRNSTSPDIPKNLGVRLISVQVFNASKESYLIRHTAAGGKTAAGTTVIPFGFENSNENYGSGNTDYNWIADTEWNNLALSMVSDNKMTLKTPGHFINQPYESNGVWSIDNPQFGMLNSYGLLDRDWNECKYLIEGDNQGYIPFYYVSENTLPSHSFMTLPFATGIYFRTVICDYDSQDKQSIISDRAEKARILMDDGSFLDLDFKSYENQAIGDNMTIAYAQNGYYLNYRYLIEHNRPDQTNNIDGKTGSTDITEPMQIGVVRNNIYKINIKGIDNLPDPSRPTDIKVDCLVLPWGVRLDENVIIK